MKYGLVLEGGAMRGLFTAGVLDVFLENGIAFDGIIGVSAGAAFGCNLKSGQAGRVLRYNKQYCRDWRYCSWRSLFLTGDMFGADFCYRKLPEELDPFDKASFEANPTEFFLVCTDVISGKPVYHRCEKADRNCMEWMRASASMPLVSSLVNIDGAFYLDGAITDSIPLDFMERQGYHKNIVILTQPEGYVKKAAPCAVSSPPGRLTSSWSTGSPSTGSSAFPRARHSAAISNPVRRDGCCVTTNGTAGTGAIVPGARCF